MRVQVAAVAHPGCRRGVQGSDPGQPERVEVMSRPRVKVGSLTGCKGTTYLGDYLVGQSSMLDALTIKVVGSFVTECFVVDARGSHHYHCPRSMIALEARGPIVFTEAPYIGDSTIPADDWPIIGGTGEFLGVTGYIIASPANSAWKYGDFVITFTKQGSN